MAQAKRTTKKVATTAKKASPATKKKVGAKARPATGAARKARTPAKSAKAPARKPQRKTLKASPAATPDLLETLVRATRLDREEVLRRALGAFAAAHGVPTGSVGQQSGIELPPMEVVSSSRPSPAANGGGEPDPEALAPDVRLYIHGKGRAPQEMIGEAYFVGSHQKCDLWVNLPRIETRHLRVIREGNRYFVEDLATSGGTLFGDGRPLVGRHELAHEDVLFLAGYHQVKFYLLGPS